MDHDGPLLGAHSVTEGADESRGMEALVFSRHCFRVADFYPKIIALLQITMLYRRGENLYSVDITLFQICRFLSKNYCIITNNNVI